MKDLTIGVLGAGLMGAPMARNLARAGHHVRAWNRSPDKAMALQDDGVACAASPRAAAAGVDVLIVMVSTGDVADRVLFEDDDCALRGLRRGATVVMMSSIPVETARNQAARLSEFGVRYLDAPVSGGVIGAKEGRLVIMAGGDEALIGELADVFGPLGAVTRVGDVGAGQLSKLANQMIVGTTIAAVAEALILAEAGGADPGAVRQALMGGFADSRILREHGARMVEGAFTPGGHATTQLKDLTTARRLGDELGLALPVASLVERLFGEMCAGGRGELDHSALYLELMDISARRGSRQVS